MGTINLTPAEDWDAVEADRVERNKWEARRIAEAQARREAFWASGTPEARRDRELWDAWEASYDRDRELWERLGS